MIPLLDFGYGQTSEKQIYVHLVCVAQAASVAPFGISKLASMPVRTLFV
jgi:hypothetical protein